MARQARSQATRRKIIDAAVELFGTVGYGSTGLAEIAEYAHVTKGAFYYHFESKESLASAVIDETTTAVVDTFVDICKSAAPALENLIHGTFVIADLMANDELVRIGGQLGRALPHLDAAARGYTEWTAAVMAQVAQSRNEGDLRDDLDTDTAGEFIIAALAGAQLMSTAITGRSDLQQRWIRMWRLMLPAVVAPESLSYFCEFMEREAVRGVERGSSPD